MILVAPTYYEVDGAYRKSIEPYHYPFCICVTNTHVVVRPTHHSKRITKEEYDLWTNTHDRD